MLVMRLAKDHTPLWDWEALGRQAPEAFLSVVTEYFDKAAGLHETDAIVAQELVGVMRGTCQRIGLNAGLEQMEAEESQTLEVLLGREVKRWGRGDNRIDLTGVIRIWNSGSWRTLLPEIVTTQLPRLANRQVRRSSPVKRPKPLPPATVWLWEDLGEDGAGVIIQSAKEIFLQADEEHQGQVQGSECGTLILALFSTLGLKDFPAEIKFNLQHLCAEMVKLFDLEGTGKINFLEFLRMVCMKPFKQLIPKRVAQRLPLLVCKIVKLAIPPEEEDEEEDIGEVAFSSLAQCVAGSREEGRAVLKMAQELFSAADDDGSGEVDEEELMGIIVELQSKLGHAMGEEDLRREVKRCMHVFDTDRSGTIDFNEFLQMILREPWRALLPEEGITQVSIMLARFERAEAARRRGRPKWIWEESVNSHRDPSMVLLDVTRELFEEVLLRGRLAGTQGYGGGPQGPSGVLEEEEVATYFKTLFIKLGKKLSADVIYSLLPHVRRGIQQFGPLVRAKAALTYGQVLTLLVQKPWRDFVPQEVRLAFTRVAVNLIKASQAGELGSVSEAMDATRHCSPAGREVVHFAKALFEEADGDRSGTIDLEELKVLLEALGKKLGLQLDRRGLDALQRKAMETFRAQAAVGDITFGSFLSMLHQEPFKSQLPHEVVQELPGIIASLVRAGKERGLRGGGGFHEWREHGSSPGEAAVKLAQEVFHDADEDRTGYCTPEQVAGVIHRFWRAMGSSIHSDYRIRMVQEVRAGLARMGIMEGEGVSFPRLLNLVVCPPWSKQLPKVVREGGPEGESGLPLLVLSMMQRRYPQPGDEMEAVMGKLFAIHNMDGTGEMKIKACLAWLFPTPSALPHPDHVDFRPFSNARLYLRCTSTPDRNSV